MNQRELKRYMRLGHGRCRIFLEKAPCLAPYRQAVLWGCLHCFAYDAQCEGTRAAYLYGLVSCFGDDAYFAAPVIQAFNRLPKRSDWVFLHFCELLSLFAQNGSSDAKAALYGKYQTLLKELLRAKHKRGYDFAREQFEHICIALTSLDGQNAFLTIAEDMGMLFHTNARYDSSDFPWYYANAAEKLGAASIKRLLRRESNRSANIRCFYEQWTAAEQVRVHRQQTPAAAPDADALIAEVTQSGRLSPVTRFRFAKRAAAAEQEKLALAALQETNPAAQAALLSVFAVRGVPFPLSHDHLITAAQSAHPQVQAAALEVLTQCRSEAVRAYALALLSDQQHIHSAIQMLIENDTPRDNSLLLQALANLPTDPDSASEQHAVVLKILDGFDAGIRLPANCLLYIYETTPCSCCRASAVRRLAKCRRLTPQIIAECRYDCSDDLTRYINRYYPACAG